MRVILWLLLGAFIGITILPYLLSLRRICQQALICLATLSLTTRRAY